MAAPNKSDAATTTTEFDNLFSSVCETPFWNSTLTWYTSDPDLTPCFENTLLTWLPALILLLSTPFELKWYYTKHAYKVPGWTALSLTKTIIAGVLLLNSITQLIYALLPSESVTGVYLPASYVMASIVRTIAMVIVIVFVQMDRKRAFVTNGPLWIFWFLTTIAETIMFRSRFNDYYSDEIDGASAFLPITSTIYFGGACLLLVISCFADVRSDRPTEAANECPELRASFPNKLLFWWFTGMAITGHRRPLDQSDMWAPNPEDVTEVVVRKIELHWAKQMERHRQSLEAVQQGRRKKPYQPSVLRVLIAAFWPMELAAASLKLCNDLLTFVSPQILNVLIAFVAAKELSDDVETSSPVWRGYFFAALLFTSAIGQTMLLHQYFHRAMRLGLQIRAGIMAAIYRKSLRMSTAEKRDRTIGETVNLMSVDAQRLQDLMTYLNMIWSAPLQITLALYFLWQALGVAAIAGFAVMVLMLPLNALIAILMRKLQVKQMRRKDERIKSMTEIMNGIKVLKLYAWEESFQELILKTRKSELRGLMHIAYLNAGSSFVWTLAPFIVALCSFATYIWLGNHLNAQKAFVSLALFNILRFPLSMLPMIISFLVQAQVSIQRIGSYMAAAEFDPAAVRQLAKDDPEAGADSIVIRDGTFTWSVASEQTAATESKAKNGIEPDGDEAVQSNAAAAGEVAAAAATLRSINLRVGEGKLVALVGSVGAGKSSLCSALLGLMEKVSGDVQLKGDLAYVAQQAWIQNATVRDNILFSRPFKAALYEAVLDACALRSDLAILPAGDATEIGEKGINLSGGQKQRVALARAVYARADVYILDDPLAAVDAHVGKHIFDEVLSSETGLLRNRTRLLITHGVGFLSKCDWIVVMRDGEISEEGTYRQLLDANGAFAAFLNEHVQGDAGDSLEEQLDEAELAELQKRGFHLQRAFSSESTPEKVAAPPPDANRRDSTPSKRKLRLLDDVDDEERKALLLAEEPPNSPVVARESASNHVVEGMSVQESKRSGKSGARRQDDDAVTKTTPSFRKHGKKSKGKQADDVEGGGGGEHGRLIGRESAETGNVRLKIYALYMRYVSILATVLTLLFYALYNAMSVGSNLWLSEWSEDPVSNDTEADLAQSQYRLGVYAGFGGAQSVFILLASGIVAYGTILASKNLHNTMLDSILKAPMAFFDTTPIGRIVNRFSKDIDVVDVLIPMNFRMFLQTMFSVLSTVFVISYSTPIFVVVIPPLVILYYLVQRFYIATSRQLKRIESVSRSPIYSHFQESISGAATIIAFRQQERFIVENELRVDTNNVAYYPNIASQRWLAVRLEFVANSIVFFAALFAVFSRDGDSITAGQVGLSISYAMSVTQTLNWMVRMTSELETNIVAVERIKEYVDVEQEAPRRLLARGASTSRFGSGGGGGAESPRRSSAISLNDTWPQQGQVRFVNYQTRYRQGLDLVLRGVTCEIAGGEKIGIVGRTGAGKSSLTLALFRIIEPAGGNIYIDTVDIARLGLHDLRSRLTIIPQDPVLFSGTLRMNLDPFGKYTDAELWSALEHSQLKRFVQAQANQLDFVVAEEGSNMSVGQRQLVCLARALLRNTRVLILDEATAAIDLDTDDFIQRTIRTEFKHCTVLTIAHRINTIMDSSRVMVLDEGRVREFAPPGELLQNPDSLFYKLCKDAKVLPSGLRVVASAGSGLAASGASGGEEQEPAAAKSAKAATGQDDDGAPPAASSTPSDAATTPDDDSASNGDESSPSDQPSPTS